MSVSASVSSVIAIQTSQSPPCHLRSHLRTQSELLLFTKLLKKTVTESHYEHSLNKFAGCQRLSSGVRNPIRNCYSTSTVFDRLQASIKLPDSHYLSAAEFQRVRVGCYRDIMSAVRVMPKFSVTTRSMVARTQRLCCVRNRPKESCRDVGGIVQPRYHSLLRPCSRLYGLRQGSFRVE